MRPIRPSDLDALVALAEAAGRVVLSVYGQDFEHRIKADASPVTEADLRSDALLREGLAREFGGIPVVSEESSPVIPAGAQEFFLVDPLDGTREFLQRNGEFTVNIGWIQAGVPVAGVVLVPVLGQVYFGARGLGAWRRVEGQTRALPAEDAGRSGSLRVVASRSHATTELDAWLAALAVPHTVVRAGSSLKFCRLAEGAADLYPRFGPTAQWDTAAGQAVLEAAGGQVLDESGQPLCYGSGRSILNGPFLAKRQASLQVPWP